MAILLTYDIRTKHVEVKDAMKTLGYTDQFWYNGKWLKLPNTTLRHESKSPATATDELKAVCNRLGAGLERSFATEMVANNWSHYG